MRVGTFFIAPALSMLNTIALYSAVHADDALKPLPETTLYQKIAHGCHDVPLATWRHPTRKVLLEQKIPLDSLELCNGGTYPIYHVRFRYEPRVAHNNPFYMPLYDAMLRANGRYSFAFVDSEFNWISYISSKKGVINEESDEYAP